MNHYSPIGINMNGDSISALQVLVNGRGLKLGAATHQTLDNRLTGSADDMDTLKPAIQALAVRRLFNGKRAIIALPQAYLYTFPVAVEIRQQQPFEEALSHACSKHLNFPIEEAVIDYFCIQNDAIAAGQNPRVTVVAAHRKLIDLIIKTFNKTGLKIDIIEYGLSALIRLHNHIHTLTEAPSVLVQMDAGSTLMVVATKSDIVAHRHLDWGSGRLLRGLAESLGIDANSKQALTILHDYGLAFDARQEETNRNPPQQTTEDIATLRVASQILMPYVEELVHELYQMFGYMRSVSPDLQCREIWLYGEATRIKHLGPFLKKRLQIPTHRMDLSAKLSLHNSDILGAAGLIPYVNALGLTLREAI